MQLCSVENRSSETFTRFKLAVNEGMEWTESLEKRKPTRKMDEITKLEALIKKHYASLCAVALHFVGSPDIAQDITQEVFIKFWENREQHKAIQSLDNFLYVMVRNEALNYLRTMEREKQRYSQLETTETEDPHVFNLLVEEEINQVLMHAINQLPLQMARIMRLVLSDYENKEIAQIMGISINTIKTLKYAAIRKLRAYFDKNNYRVE